jgi:Pyridoxamine 5'-phosphate oxidase
MRTKTATNSAMIKIAFTCLLSSLVVATDEVSKNDACPCALVKQPDLRDKEATARWMVHSLDWGVLSTISSRFTDQTAAVPFGNIYSFVDGTCDNSTGIPYIYGTYMDQSFQDSLLNTAVSFTLSEASLASVCGGSNLPSCKIHGFGDPENPPCARLTLTGVLSVVLVGDSDDDEDNEFYFAQKALFQRHSSMENWPRNHKWIIAKIEIQDIWLIDYFGGASILDVEKYRSVDLTPVLDAQE